MGSTVSAGCDNDELTDNLCDADYIRSAKIERLFRAVDRGEYILPEYRMNAYKDQAWRSNHLHLSAPCIYSEVLEGLGVAPGMSFLNLGSGTGYLSTLVGLILGHNGINHGVEYYEDVIQYANKKLEDFKRYSGAIDEFDFCEPKFMQGNCLCLTTDRRYDRVYVGAACPVPFDRYLKSFVKVGGILVMPFHDQLMQVHRTTETSWIASPLLPVNFATLITPKEDCKETVELMDIEPASLQSLCRTNIRNLLRNNVVFENPNLSRPAERQKKSPRKSKAGPRHVCREMEEFFFGYVVPAQPMDQNNPDNSNSSTAMDESTENDSNESNKSEEPQTNESSDANNAPMSDATLQELRQLEMYSQLDIPEPPSDSFHEDYECKKPENKTSEEVETNEPSAPITCHNNSNSTVQGVRNMLNLNVESLRAARAASDSSSSHGNYHYRKPDNNKSEDPETCGASGPPTTCRGFCSSTKQAIKDMEMEYSNLEYLRAISVTSDSSHEPPRSDHQQRRKFDSGIGDEDSNEEEDGHESYPGLDSPTRLSILRLERSLEKVNPPRSDIFSQRPESLDVETGDSNDTVCMDHNSPSPIHEEYVDEFSDSDDEDDEPIDTEDMEFYHKRRTVNSPFTELMCKKINELPLPPTLKSFLNFYRF